MKRFISLGALAVLLIASPDQRGAWGPSRCATVVAQAPKQQPAQPPAPKQSVLDRFPPKVEEEVDSDAVRRMGDYVRHLDGFGQEPDLFSQVAGQPPASDADKWFISVVTMQSCPACTKLKQAWATNENLRAYARPDDPKTSWAHFHYFDKDDQSQAWRWKNIQITSYPTVLVQPPRTGKYGPPDTVVFQQTYGGNPDTLATNMARAIKRYLSAPREGYQQTGVDPPWKPKPKVDPPPSPNMPWPTPGPQVPPDLHQESKPNLLLWGGIALAVWYFFRNKPPAPTVALLLAVGLTVGAMGCGGSAKPTPVKEKDCCKPCCPTEKAKP